MNSVYFQVHVIAVPGGSLNLLGLLKLPDLGRFGGWFSLSRHVHRYLVLLVSLKLNIVEAQ